MPQIGPDTFEYYEIVRMLKGIGVRTIGFPGVGFPVFLKTASFINNSLLFVVFLQTILQFISIAFFLFIYNRYYKKYFYWVLFIMLGYLGASFNQYYDTCLYPDSLLSSMFIFAITLLLFLFNSKSKYINLTFFLLSVISVYAISIRANGILLVPLIFIYLLWDYLTKKNIKQSSIKISLFIIPLFVLMIFNSNSPIYKTISPIGARKIMYEDTTGYRFEFEKDSTWTLLKKIVPEGYFYKEYDKGLFNNYSSATYINSYSKGFRVIRDSNQHVIVQNYSDVKMGNAIFNVTHYVDSFANDQNYNLDKLNSYFTKTKSKAISIEFNSTLKNQLLLFISFYKFFYVKEIKNFFTKENDFYYEDNIKNNFWRLYLLHQGMKSFHQMYPDVFKEFDKTPLVSSKGFIDKYKTNIYWSFKSSRYYRYFVKPYYEFNNLVYRNWLFPMLFLIMYLIVFIRILKRDFHPLLLFLFSLGGLLILTNILHSFYLGFLLSRYTYQVSFIYYIFVAFIPYFIIFFRNRITSKKLND